jgi:hypothetical protein
LQFAVDGEEIGKITPPGGGFWEFGMFNSSIGTADNPWIYGTKMAPFDKEVSRRNPLNKISLCYMV